MPSLRRHWLKIALVLTLFLGLSSCGGGSSPPVPIPAPVSALLTVSPPDGSGFITLSGAPDSVLPGALVTGTNATATGLAQKWPSLWVRDAHAQQQPPAVFTDETVADSQGSFTLRLNGKSGDVLFIQQQLNGETSEITERQVP